MVKMMCLQQKADMSCKKNLQSIGKQIANGWSDGVIIDINGNKVGNWSVE